VLSLEGASQGLARRGEEKWGFSPRGSLQLGRGSGYLNRWHAGTWIVNAVVGRAVLSPKHKVDRAINKGKIVRRAPAGKRRRETSTFL